MGDAPRKGETEMISLSCLICLTFILVSCNGELNTYDKGKELNFDSVMLKILPY